MEVLQLFKSKIFINSSNLKYYVHFTKKINYSQFNNSDHIIFADANLKKFNFKIYNKLNKERLLLIKASENSKSFSEIQVTLKKIMQLGVTKKTSIVVIGGGIIQDIASFIASIYMRGITWIFIPTTLAAQADSCIGSKTSINFNGIKNILGTFYPPKKVLIDLSFLKSLNKSQILCGLGEILHYYCYGGLKYLNLLEKFNFYNLSNFDDLKMLIYHSLIIKKKMVEKDEFDRSQRRLFNFGHTFGHALEGYFNFKIPHGRAVATGIDIANYFSLRKKFIGYEEFKKINSIIKKIEPRLNFNNFNKKKYISFLLKDKKKISRNQVSFILMYAYGDLREKKLKLDGSFKKILQDYVEIKTA